MPPSSLSVSYVSICFHKLFFGLYGCALSVSFCIAPWSLFVFLSLFGTFLWACCRFPSRHTHTLLSRCIARASVVVLTPSPSCVDLSINQFCFASALMLAFMFPCVCPMLLSVSSSLFPSSSCPVHPPTCVSLLFCPPKHSFAILVR